MGQYCNFCIHFSRVESSKRSLELQPSRIYSLIRRKTLKSSRYDCVIGFSGGVDSAYVALLAKRLGLKALLVHMDNCWNSAVATRNIERVASTLGFDLEVVVLPWDTQRQLQRAMFSADVVDVDLPYDNALHEVCYSLAKKHKVRTILGGSNASTEGMPLPSNWAWYPWDGRNVRAIARSAGVNLKGYPVFTPIKLLWYRIGLGIVWLDLLDLHGGYKKEMALKELEEICGFQNYGGKHFENSFTRFFQAFILPKKFGIDKRKNHLSAQVLNGELNRDEALLVLERDPYPSPVLLNQDLEEVCERLGVSRSELDHYLTRQRREHAEFGHSWSLALLRLALAFRSKLRRDPRG